MQINDNNVENCTKKYLGKSTIIITDRRAMKAKEIYSAVDDIPFLNLDSELEAEIQNNLNSG